MIVVTGGAGFIGSNLVRELNRRGREDILVVDDLSRSDKFENLVGAAIADYLDKEDFAARMAGRSRDLPPLERVFHQGACTSTTETDGRYMMRNNHEYSKVVLDFCVERQIPLIYASSAAVYGAGRDFAEQPRNEEPLNVYGFSKLLFDEHVRRLLPTVASQVVGLRYFNVFGPREGHKGPMASMVMQLDDQLATGGKARLFGASQGYEPGEQQRDFVYVDDVVAVNLWFMQNPDKSGIFNCGSGESRTFNDLASAVLRFRGTGDIEYIPFPAELEDRYQSFTRADLDHLRATGYGGEFTSLEAGVEKYLTWRRQRGEG